MYLLATVPGSSWWEAFIILFVRDELEDLRAKLSWLRQD